MLIRAFRSYVIFKIQFKTSKIWRENIEKTHFGVTLVCHAVDKPFDIYVLWVSKSNAVCVSEFETFRQYVTAHIRILNTLHKKIIELWQNHEIVLTRPRGQKQLWHSHNKKMREIFALCCIHNRLRIYLALGPCFFLSISGWGNSSMMFKVSIIMGHPANGGPGHMNS